MGFELPWAGPEPPSSSFDPSARRFWPTCASSDATAGGASGANGVSLGMLGAGGRATAGTGAFERFAIDFNSRGVARSGGGGGPATAFDAGLGLGFVGCGDGSA